MKVLVTMGLVWFSAIGACGNADELKAAQVKVEALQKENASLKGVVTELNGNVSKLSSERDELKAQVEKAATVAAAPPPAAPAKTPAKAPAKKKHK